MNIKRIHKKYIIVLKQRICFLLHPVYYKKKQKILNTSNILYSSISLIISYLNNNEKFSIVNGFSSDRGIVGRRLRQSSLLGPVNEL